MSVPAGVLHFMVLLGSVYCYAPKLRAQTPLDPDWIQVWPFGQDPQYLSAFSPAWQDNHAAVDAVTGHVHVSISDETLSASPRSELLYTFNSDGSELTPAPTPLLNPVSGAEYAELYDVPYNLLGTRDLAAYDGRVSAAHHSLLIADRTQWFSSRDAIGARWNATHGWFHPAAPLFMHVAMNAEGVFMANSHMLPWDGTPWFPGFPSSVFRYSSDGWPLWRRPLTELPHDMVVSDGIVYVLTGLFSGSLIERYSMADGTPLPSINLGIGVQRLLIINGEIYTAAEGSNVTLRRHAANGAVVWATNYPMGGSVILTGMAADALGRVWASASKIDPDQIEFQGGRLVGADALGTALGTWSYGASMNGLATDGENLYLTGAVTSTGTDTYLIAKGIALITGIEATSPDIRHTLWPIPANDVLHMTMDGDGTTLAIEDAMGRRVAEQDARGEAGRVTLDVSSIAPGHYLLRSLDPTRPWAAPLIIAR